MANYTTLGQLCIVSFCAFWNDYLRREYVIVKGKLDPNERRKKVVDESLRRYASYDIWGDLNYLRNSIVHNQGIAFSDVEKCKILKWFNPGNSINMSYEKIQEMFYQLILYRNSLFEEQFPRRYMSIPLYPGAR